MRSYLRPPKDDSTRYFTAHYYKHLDNADSIGQHKITSGRHADNTDLYRNKASIPCAKKIVHHTNKFE